MNKLSRFLIKSYSIVIISLFITAGSSQFVLALDADNDGIEDKEEAGGSISNGQQILTEIDSDSDGLDDLFDADATGGVDDNGDGIDDSFTMLDSDEDGIPDLLDLDSDNDLVPDVTESNIDTDSDGIANNLDDDSDNDGILDSLEADVAESDFDNDGIDDVFDANSDNDLVIDFNKIDENDDGIHDSIGTDSDEDGIADYIDADSDNDGLPDAIEGMADGIILDTDGDGIPNYRDSDSDNDGITDAVEMTHAIRLFVQNHALVLPHDFHRNVANAINTDTDDDGVVDLFDADIDGGGGVEPGKEDVNLDGINDAVLIVLGISMPNPSNVSALDADNNGIADYLEFPASARSPSGDADNDGISNIVECLSGEDFRLLEQESIQSINPTTQCIDSDGDGALDLFDTDSDNDSVLDLIENGPAVISLNIPWDTDRDGIFNFRDIDSDNDTLLDEVEVGESGDAAQFNDSDGDGIPDIVDRQINSTDSNDDDLVPDFLECPVYPNCPDTDRDGQPDYSDSDSDNDGIPDRLELYALLDTDNDGIADWYDADEDGDGQVDTRDTNVIKLDINGDGVIDDVSLPDFDGDGLPNHQDLDSDEDGLSDTEESIAMAIDSDNDGIDDAYDADLVLGQDSNFDGYDDTALDYVIQVESDSERVAVNTGDADSDGIPDYLDLGGDSDGDGMSDASECEYFPNCLKQDSDGDNVADFIDPETQHDIDSETEGLGAFSIIHLIILIWLTVPARHAKILSSIIQIRAIKNLILRCFYVLLLLAATQTYAFEPYLGTGITYGKHEINIDNEYVESEEDQNYGNKAYIGIVIKKGFRFELAYSDFGETELKSNPTPLHPDFINSAYGNDETGKVATTLIEASSSYTFFTGKLRPYIKMGVASLNRESDNDAFKLSNEQETKPVYGFGLDIPFNKQWHLRSQADLINTTSNYWVGISLEYVFALENSPKDRPIFNSLFSEYTTPTTHTLSEQSAGLGQNTNAEDVDSFATCDDISSYLKNVSFRPQTAELEGYAKARLLDLARILSKPSYQSLKLHLKGYADIDGQPLSSLGVSSKRAETVSRYLIQQGVSSSKLLAQGYGKVNKEGDEVGVALRCIDLKD